MWELTFDAPKGDRLTKDVFFGVDVKEPKDKDLDAMWCEVSSRKFKKLEDVKGNGSTYLRGVNSLKAFKRYLKKHCDHLKEYEIVLLSHYYKEDTNGKFLYDYSVTARWEGEGEDNASDI